eukprot:TRINITY_DN9964_c0_g1_i7.p1 TRINITY_DN9964_c0_g1~~TRINITY_DN9964_c0_g1_i7.p1  ORF type:complete len:182 (+),score=45.44 TRINITY_DN9964_c0_g1_i7:146-691(+)
MCIRDRNRVQSYVVAAAEAKLGQSCRAWYNAAWLDAGKKCLTGEADIVLTDLSATEVIAIVEVKKRPFDIYEGYRQSTEQTENKVWLRLSEGQLIKVDRSKCRCFVSTYLSEMTYPIGAETEVKSVLGDMLHQQNVRRECTFVPQDYTDALQAKVGARESPAQWLLSHGHDCVLIAPDVHE